MRSRTGSLLSSVIGTRGRNVYRSQNRSILLTVILMLMLPELEVAYASITKSHVHNRLGQ
jgi:hypothetical protein